ncbi:MAG TPA: hypothetical protein VEH27_00715 [Methylomirabilota bacterium]|nr:hypothetical protein [Methylomirabilota bacterium]
MKPFNYDLNNLYPQLGMPWPETLANKFHAALSECVERHNSAQEYALSIVARLLIVDGIMNGDREFADERKALDRVRMHSERDGRRVFLVDEKPVVEIVRELKDEQITFTVRRLDVNSQA